MSIYKSEYSIILSFFTTIFDKVESYILKIYKTSKCSSMFTEKECLTLFI